MASMLVEFVKILQESVEELKSLGLVGLLEDVAQMVKKLKEVNDGLANDKINVTAKFISIISTLYEKDPNSHALHKLEQLFILSLWNFLHAPQPKDPNPGNFLPYRFILSLWNYLRAPQPKDPNPGNVLPYRSADGSGYFNNIGQSGSAYKQDVPPKHVLRNPPKPEDVFDKILARHTFKPHPCGLSSSVFHMATLITHDLFNTEYHDPSKNRTTSYLDASWLYGWNQPMQDSVRDKTGGRGRLFNDTLADKRFVVQPPGVIALAILFCRNHNYIADELYKRRAEEPRFEDLVGGALDEQLFQTARAINIAMYANVVINDYLRALMGITRTQSAWALHPNKRFTKEWSDDIPSAIGNNCSIEFNFIYRWHSAISENDEAWFNDRLQTLLPPGKSATSDNILELIKHMGHHGGDAFIPTEVDLFSNKHWHKRQLTPDGKVIPYSDQTIADAFRSAIESPAGGFGGQNIPKSMKAIEILGITNARDRFSVCTFNDYRRWLHLKPYESIEEMNSDPAMVAALTELYGDIENVELYPGLVAEGAMKVEPGVGLASGDTIVTAILSDAVALVRGDKFLTVDLTPASLTKWGYEWCQSIPDVNQGGIIGSKIIPHTLPGFPVRWIGTAYPFCTPQWNEKEMPEKVRHNYEIKFPVADYQICNSTCSDLMIQEVFKHLEDTGDVKIAEGDIVPILKDQNVVLHGCRPVSHEEERLLVVYDKNRKKVFEHSLVGLPYFANCIIPLPKAPNRIGYYKHQYKYELVPAVSRDSNLVLSALSNCKKSLKIIQDYPHLQPEREFVMDWLAKGKEKEAENENTPTLAPSDCTMASPPSHPIASPSAAASAAASAASSDSAMSSVRSSVCVASESLAICTQASRGEMIDCFQPATGVIALETVNLLSIAPLNSPVVANDDSTTDITRYRGEVGSLNNDEELAREKRMKHIKAKVPHAPKIALCMSGGGMRATLASIGFIIGMKAIGVLDISLYLCGLSGSTWSLGPWMNSTTNPFAADKRSNAHDSDLWNFDAQSSTILGDLDLTKILTIASSNYFEWAHFYKHLPLLIKSRSMLYVYADILGKKFGIDTEAVAYEEWRTKANSGKYPIPVCTSCFKDDRGHFRVAEHTPYEIGSTFLGTYFKPESYALKDFTYNLPMSINNMMAVWGSVFYANLDQAVDLPPIIRTLIGGLSLPGAKVANANFRKKHPETNAWLPLANQQHLYYRDCGMHANLPVGPMMQPERSNEVLIVLDTSAGVLQNPFQELTKEIPKFKVPVERNGIKYPYVAEKTEHHPTIIYMPLLQFHDVSEDSTLFKFDPSQFSTYELVYSNEEASKMIQLAYETVLRAKTAIWEVINKNNPAEH